MSAIWRSCAGERYVSLLRSRAIRVVESQAQVATLALVDNAEEQYVLEQIIEANKPPQPAGADRYHYLLWTPFRYPPLPYGSRFGTRAESGIFYASTTMETALIECAYYRFYFISGMATPLPAGRLTTEHTTFEVNIVAQRGVVLDQAPFDQYRGQISAPASYHESQALGRVMREQQVDACRYASARDTHGGSNVAAFTLQAILSLQPEDMRQWIAVTTPQEVSFTQVHSTNPPRRYGIESFLRNGILPVPAP